MPIVTASYKPLTLSKKGWASTIYAGLFRKVKGVNREEILIC